MTKMTKESKTKIYFVGHVSIGPKKEIVITPKHDSEIGILNDSIDFDIKLSFEDIMRILEMIKQ
ncbi:MAG: hypothetical protein IKR17_03660 [Bacteroidales bacterium]|nr:hypothetical protein [Bacteroidales bacterium]